jgi:hypothetical protein
MLGEKIMTMAVVYWLKCVYWLNNDHNTNNNNDDCDYEDEMDNGNFNDLLFIIGKMTCTLSLLFSPLLFFYSSYFLNHMFQSVIFSGIILFLLYRKHIGLFIWYEMYAYYHNLKSFHFCCLNATNVFIQIILILSNPICMPTFKLF